jgi:predicted pyridoxine 5'-phosphate oxidase superfamily flavin-nucleotide-binding protein
MKMVITEEVKKVIEGSGFLTLVTVHADGTPHPIIAGKGEVSGDTVVFGIYKMEETQKNLLKNKNAWIVGATKTAGPKGFRLTGTAEAQGKQLIFTAAKVDILI